MSSPQSNDPLSATLREWRVNPPADPQFRPQVWARIGTAVRPSTWSRFARSHPALVASMLGLAVLAGAFSGRVEARQRAAADQFLIASQYVHALDARWQRQP